MPYDYYYKPTKPRETDEGIKARSRRGAFAQNWWAQRWIEALERLMDSGRLSRGRSYARKGQVLSVEEVKGGIEARVQGSRPKPYRIHIQLTPLSDAQWDRVIDALSEEALFSAQLLAGEMPQDIENAFQAAGASLFPARWGDLTTECSCPDPANPCKHIAAAQYILGERFDEDPFLLFRLRGRTQEQVMQGLRQRRAGQAEMIEEPEEPDIAPPLEENLEKFWDMGGTIEELPVSIQPPPIEMPLLKRLGKAAFAPEPGLEALLRGAYLAMQKEALRAALQDEEEISDQRG
jgi:uncharacterized Zn finger protein